MWLDVFQKIKALGYNGVSFYVDWALVEGKQGDFSAEGIFAWEPFFEAATKAGIYLIAVSQSCYYFSFHLQNLSFQYPLAITSGVLRPSHAQNLPICVVVHREDVLGACSLNSSLLATYCTLRRTFGI